MSSVAAELGDEKSGRFNGALCFRTGELVVVEQRVRRGVMFNFEKLDVWRKAIDFADTVYSLTRCFPEDERFGLTSQMRRAAVSISSNIAEGSARHSRDDYARFLEIATGSLFEVVSQSFIARNQGFLAEADFRSIYSAAEEQSRMLSGLRAFLGAR
jgi:four helix bundle protein